MAKAKKVSKRKSAKKKVVQKTKKLQKKPKQAAHHHHDVRSSIYMQVHVDRPRKGIKKIPGRPSGPKRSKFCKMIKEKKGIIFENEHIVVALGRQHHKGHLVILTRVHEENLLRLHYKTLDSFINDTVHIMKALDTVLKPALFNLEYLDNWDAHVHWNVYPRFVNDPDYGQPPEIPKKGEKFKDRSMSKKEIDAFKKKIKELVKKNLIW